MGELTTMMAMGALREAVIEKVPFDQVPDALTRVAVRKTMGKCVVDVRS